MYHLGRASLLHRMYITGYLGCWNNPAVIHLGYFCRAGHWTAFMISVFSSIDYVSNFVTPPPYFFEICMTKYLHFKEKDIMLLVTWSILFSPLRYDEIHVDVIQFENNTVMKSYLPAAWNTWKGQGWNAPVPTPLSYFPLVSVIGYISSPEPKRKFVAFLVSSPP